MKKIVLTAIPILLAMLACSDMIPLGPSTAKRSYVLKEHPDTMTLSVTLNCPYEKKCTTEIFWGVGFTYARSADSYSCISGYEYRYVSKEGANKIYSGETTPVTLDSDDHVRFSLFDSKNVEKTYDIDLSEMVRSYFVKEDSLYIKIPENMSYLAIGIKRPDGYQNVEIMDSVIENGYFVHVANESLRSYFYMDQEFSNQSSFGTDSIHVFATLYWRE